MNGGEKRYPDEEFIQAVREYNPASTSEVAESVGCTRRNADIRLKKLAEEGQVKQKKIAASQVWVVAEDQ
jgi:predicted transcriptional regulator